jgi:hypothetical protein
MRRQGSFEMQEPLIVSAELEPEPEPQPELMSAPTPELTTAMVPSSGTPADSSAGEDRPEAEPPQLSRNEELVDTAKKMYYLGFCFLYAHRSRVARCS